MKNFIPPHFFFGGGYFFSNSFPAYPKWREFIDTDLQIEIRKQDRALGAGLSIMDSEIFVSSSPSVESDSTDDENLSASDENDVLNAAAAVQNALGLVLLLPFRFLRVAQSRFFFKIYLFVSTKKCSVG